MSANNSVPHSIRGPVTIITVGVLFALNNFTPYGFEKTWPVILIVFGLLSLWKRALGPEPVPPPPNYVYTPPPVAYNPPPAGFNPPPTLGTGRGGFGSSAPQRAPGDSQADAPPPVGGTT